MAESASAHPFWSGTLTFGLVSIPVDMFATVRSRRPRLRMLTRDGQPLQRRYVCPREQMPLADAELVRGYPWDTQGYVVVSDEEMQRLAPRKSRDIELRQFVRQQELDPLLFQRVYVLGPAGASTRAYHLLATTMQQLGRAGIAEFVMRGRAYLAAIFAEAGLLWAITLRYADELRGPADIGLPARAPARPQRVEHMRRALSPLQAPQLDRNALRDTESEALRKLAQRKYAAGRDVLEAPSLQAGEAAQPHPPVDLMQVLKQRVEMAPREPKRVGGPPSGDSNAALASKSKKELYEQARALSVPGRSRMSKQQLIDAIAAAG